MKRGFLIIFCVLLSAVLRGQVFVAKTISGISVESDGAIDVGDYDQDGDLDFAVMGKNASIFEGNVATGSVGFTGIYKNVNGEFTGLSDLNLLEAFYGDIAWGDFDQDGDLDLIISGHPTGPNYLNTKVLALYKNTGNDQFELINTNIVPFSSGKFALVDFDKDGLLDIGITGFIEGPFSSVGFADVYKNYGNFNFQRMNLGIAQVGSGVLNFIDIENDGDWDVILNGFTSDATYKTFFYLNNSGSLIPISTDLDDFLGASAGVYDLNNDGYDDVVFSGVVEQPSNQFVLKVYTNAHGTLQNTQTLDGLKEGTIDFGDFDNDQDIDLLITGATDSYGQSFATKIIRNDGTVFTELPNVFEGSFRGGAIWGDFDLDNDYDFIKFPNNTILYSQCVTNAISLEATICSNTSYNFYGRTLTQSGIYTENVSGVDGCQKLVTLSLTVNPPSSSSIAAAICSGSSYLFNNQNIFSSGTYSMSTKTNHGCDSIVTLTLTVMPPIQSASSASICLGSSFLFGGTQLSVGGSYTKVFKSVQGCDSTVTLVLSVEEVSTEIKQEGSHLQAIENNAQYQWYDCLEQKNIEGENDKIFKVLKDGIYAVLVKKGSCILASACTVAYSIFENYPNPAKDKVSFKLPQVANDIKVQMFNTSGILVATWQFSNVEEFEIMIGSFTDGLYFFEVLADDKVEKSRVIKWVD